MRSTLLQISGLSAVLMLTACSAYTTQATSGQDWLAARPPQKVDMTPGNIDEAVREAAAVEPTLRFPARIGIARLNYARLTAIPADEAKAWEETAKHLGGDFGEFVPVSPLVAAMVEPPPADPGPAWRNLYAPDLGVAYAQHAIENIRLASARQHLDAVLIYETDATDDTKSNPLSLAEWTLIGAFIVPTQNVRAEGVAQAILLDVRNGYPYGTVQDSADDTTTTVRFKTAETGTALRDEVRAHAVTKLAVDTEAMMRKLRPELAALDRKQPQH